MSVQPAARVWLRNKRRLLDAQAGMARRRFRPLRNSFYEDLWAKAAADTGAQVERQPNGLTQISRRGLATFVDHSDLMLDSAVTLRVMANKAMTFKFMSGKNVRTPAFETFTLASIARAETFLERQQGPIVVKPADGTGGGRGVTTGITTSQALLAAARHAAGFNQALMVEEQLTGMSYRLLYFDGEFIDTVRRDSPTVTGDGASTITALVKAENEARLERPPITALSPLIIDQESRNTLATDGLTASHVPGNGDKVRVKLAVNENAAAQNRIVRASTHPDLIQAGSQLVKDFGIRFAGLDVTADDISATLLDGNVIFNEINVNPGIHHHYLVSNPGERADVASALLERMFGSESGTIRL